MRHRHAPPFVSHRVLPLAPLLAGLALTMAGWALPAGASAQGAPAVLERASARHEALDAFCADFVQEIEVTLLRETKRSRGELCQARSDRFDMRFTDPPGDRIVADGIYLWVYFPSMDDGAATRTRVAGTDGSFDLHREFLSNPGQRYAATLDGQEEVGGRSTYRIDLTPRAVSPYRSARVWIDAEDYLIRKITIVEESESIRTVELSNIRLNPTLPADRFRFDAPVGVQVITR